MKRVNPGVDLAMPIPLRLESFCSTMASTSADAGASAKPAGSLSGFSRGRKDRHRGVVCPVGVPQLLIVSGGSAARRRKARARSVSLSGPCALDRMSRAALFRLLDELHPCRPPPPAHAPPDAPSRRKYLRIHHAACRGDDMRQHRLAADLVQRLGPFDFSRVPLPAAMITTASFLSCS